MQAGHRFAPLFAFALAFLRASLAWADLDADAARVARAFSGAGEVRRLSPRFAERGSVRPLLLPRDFLDPLREDCVTVVVLGSRSASFVLRFLPGKNGPDWPDGEHPELAVAGAGQLVRCGIRKSMLERLAVELRSPRGALEVVVAKGPRPFVPVTRVLGERAPGPVSLPEVAAPRSRPRALADRVRFHTLRARRSGARAIARRDITADESGRGSTRFVLEPGCHRLDLLSADGGPGGADLDADLWLAPSNEPVASDRTEASDAVLTTCVAEQRIASLLFQGARPGTDVTLLAEVHALPEGLPPTPWPEESAALARALGAGTRAPALERPVRVLRGATGVTLVSLELDPAACYVLAAAAWRGRDRALALALEVGARQAQNLGGSDSPGTTLSFCAEGEARAKVNVEARGEGVSFVLALWQKGRLSPGSVRP